MEKKTKEYTEKYTEACVDAAIIINRERNQYYFNKLDSLRVNHRILTK